MPRTTETITFSLPPVMAKRMAKLMKIEGRTKSELLREALRDYIEKKEWKRLCRFGQMQARKLGITKDQVEDIVDEYRD